MNIFWAVAAGGFLGAICRFVVSNFIQSKHKKPFPFGTFAVNLIGSFLLGFLFAKHVNPLLFFFIGTGFMGSFTTFSTFELESMELIRSRKFLISLSYLLLSTILGVMLAFLGYWVGNTL